MTNVGASRLSTAAGSVGAAEFAVPDHAGDVYTTILYRLHADLSPRTYFEIGTLNGGTLALSRCNSVAVDPRFQISCDVIGGKPSCQLFQLTSDDFFATKDLSALLGRKVDFAFLDGLHLFEYLLRDFMNTESYCNSNSLVAMHDCIPTDLHIARRTAADDVSRWPASRHPDWWAGDVWKVLLILKKYRPELKTLALNAPPTGLALVTNLDANNTTLKRNYENIIKEFSSLTLERYGLAKFYSDIGVKSTDLTRDAQKLIGGAFQQPIKQGALADSSSLRQRSK